MVKKMKDQTNLLEELYQEVILEHSKKPRNKGKYKEEATVIQEGQNPLCGDCVTLYCKKEKKGEKEEFYVGFEGHGCSISQASASILTENVKGKTLEEIKEIIETAENIYTGKVLLEKEDLDSDIEALSGIRHFPVRVKCAALPWKALKMALLENKEKPPLDEKTSSSSQPQESLRRKLKVVTTE
jgi:nitrogen fixation NifU-like protein